MIPGFYILPALLARLRAEAKKTILSAATPRVVVDYVPTSGGYGIDFTPAAVVPHLPENWKTGRLVVDEDGDSDPTPRDLICPIVTRDKWLSLDSGSTIGANELSGFTREELSDGRDEAADELLNGCGLIVVSVEMLPGQPELRAAGIGSNVARAVAVSCLIIVPGGRGPSQGDLYASILSRILTDTVILVESATNSALEFDVTPEIAPITDSDESWTLFDWTAEAALSYNIPHPLRP